MERASLTPKGRELLIERLDRGERVSDVACALGVYERTVYEWRRCYREGGLTALQDRSSRPHRSPARASTACEGSDFADLRYGEWLLILGGAAVV